MNTFKITTLVIAIMAIFSTFAFGNTVDSLKIIDSTGNTYVLLTQEVADSLADTGNLNAAIQVTIGISILQKKANREQAINDSLAIIETALVKKLHTSWNKEINPMTLDSVWEWTMKNSDDTAHMKLEWLAKRYNIRVEGKTSYEMIESFKTQLQARKDFNKSIDIRINKSFTSLQKQIDSNYVKINNLEDSLKFHKQALEITYEMAKTNSANIKVLIKEVNIIKTDLWTVTAAVKRAKIIGNNDKQHDDNVRMMDNLNSKAKYNVKPIKVIKLDFTPKGDESK